MKGAPGLVFVVDIKKEDTAIKEAKKLGIPVIGIADTNVNPTLSRLPEFRLTTTLLRQSASF
jgi:small subunit ribosomal protein S2